MPRLQKSFSEQTARPSPQRSKQQWQKSKSNPVGKGGNSKPLLPVSESAKNKLQAFQFESPRTETQNEPPVKAPGKENSKHSPKPTSRVKKHTTPINPIAWQDLMNPNHNEPTEDEKPSPSDRLTWRNDPYPPMPAISPVRRRKRARSSSPIPSPAPSSSAATPNINLKGLAAVLKTPQADPALELWDRFSLTGADTSPSGPSNPLFTHLMVSSSPRPNKEATSGGPRSEKSLRKALSCGSNWPKRRRVERVGAEQGVFIGGSPRQSAKSTMLSTLLETVDTELRKSRPTEQEREQPESPSPKKRSALREDSDAQSRYRISPMELSVDPGTVKKPTITDDASSDYGEDDFDEDTLMKLDATLNLVQAAQPAPVTAPEPPPAIPAQSDSVTADDEFGDLDDDFFEGAEDLIAQVESNHQSQPTVQQQQNTGPPQGKGKAAQDEFDDEFGDDFGDDFDPDAAELAATQHPIIQAFPPASRASQKAQTIQRYLVTNVLEGSFTDERSRGIPEKVLHVQADKTKITKTIHLRGDWYDTQVHIKAYVHVIGTFEPSGRCVIDNNQNMIILHPDQLISSTVIADSFSCMRRAVLQDRVKATSEATQPLIYGTILHEIFQQALMANKWDVEYLGSIIDTALEKHLEDLWVIGLSVNAARDDLCSKMTELRGWARTFVSAYPRPDALVQGRNGDKANMCVSKLLDVEEHVWSPMYGLKGNIDATVQVTMRDAKGSKTLTVPFEVKTGKNVSTNHQAQTALYNLLLSDRYDVEIACGILYYMETSQTLRIPAVKQEVRHMIMQRNQLACYIRERSVQLPPMKRVKHTCGKCYAQASCFIYHKLADDGTGETSGLDSKFDEVVQHLAPVHKEFFLKWEDLLTKEERESQRLRRELWTMTSTEREKVGRCFANVIIEPGSASEDLNEAKINRFTYTLIKENAPPSFSFLESQLIVGEPIVISDEQGHFALALGYVTAVRKQRISVAVDRRLHNARIRQPGFDEVDNQVFASIMQVGPRDPKSDKTTEPVIRYRLDKDEFSNGMATVRNNLVQIMTNTSPGTIKTRSLVVDLAPPKTKVKATQYEVHGKDNLNPDQIAAVEKVMSAQDYALVLGMPGTGKTTTIAHIIRALMKQNKSVLLTSYTHTAVDNILLKLKHDHYPILRLGATAKIHPEVRDFVTLGGQAMGSFEEIERAWLKSPVVATTCLGINHPLFQKRIFDYCIVDEASQITLPICLGPIRMANTFVLVGDHNQLPPLVQNEEARQGGLDVSLFKLLSDTHPSSVVNLEHQYRMCEDIMGLSNALIYNGRLKCGTESLRVASLPVPNMSALRHRHFDSSSSHTHPPSLCPAPRQGACWLRDLLDPSARVRFVSTDLLSNSREEAKGNRIVNPCEAKVVAQLVDALLTVGVPADEIGVMTHYRSQLALLKHALRANSASSSSSSGAITSTSTGGIPIEMHTADRFQGRDKAVVVLSLVRSNEQCSIGELLKDWRRINVAFTRAKTKLLVVGSRRTLAGAGKDEMLVKFMGMMEQKGWVYDLQEGALEGHCFDVPVPMSVSVSRTRKGGVKEEEEEVGGVVSSGRRRNGESLVDGIGNKMRSPKRGVITSSGGGGGSSVAAAAASGLGGGEKRRKGPELLVGKKGFAPPQQTGKENQPLSSTAKSSDNGNGNGHVRRAKIGERAILKGRPILRDILNDMSQDGGY